MDIVFHLLHGTLLLVWALAAGRWNSSVYFRAGLLAGSVAPLSQGLALYFDAEWTAWFRWAAVPAAFAFLLCMSVSIVTLFSSARPVKILFALNAGVAVAVTAYYYSQTFGASVVLNALGVHDFSAPGGSLLAGLGAVYFTLCWLLSAFSPLLFLRRFPAAGYLIPGALLPAAGSILKGILVVRTFAGDARSPFLALYMLLLTVIPLAVYDLLARSVRRSMATGGGNTSSA